MENGMNVWAILTAAAGNFLIQILENSDDARRLRCGAVGRHSHEVELNRNSHVSGKVRHDDERPLQDPDHQELFACIVIVYLSTHPGERLIDSHIVSNPACTQR